MTVTSIEIAQATAIAREWQHFVRGRWQMTVPDKPGKYPVVSRDGRFSATIDTTETVAWNGWWWSVPYPALPTPPRWRFQSER